MLLLKIDCIQLLANKRFKRLLVIRLATALAIAFPRSTTKEDAKGELEIKYNKNASAVSTVSFVLPLQSRERD